MTRVKPVLCQCGEEMAVYRSYSMCPHCDLPHGPDLCVTCRRYGYYLNMRVINEHNQERQRKKETGQW